MLDMDHFYAKDGTFSQVGVYVNISFMKENDFLYKRHTDTVTGYIPMVGSAVEGLEELF